MYFPTRDALQRKGRLRARRGSVPGRPQTRTERRRAPPALPGLRSAHGAAGRGPGPDRVSSQGRGRVRRVGQRGHPLRDQVPDGVKAAVLLLLRHRAGRVGRRTHLPRGHEPAAL